MDVTSDKTNIIASYSELCINVINKLDLLGAELDKLCHLILEQDKHLPLHIKSHSNILPIHDPHSRQELVNFLKTIQFLDEQEPREIIIASGLVAASHETIKQIFVLNEAKDLFKQAILTLRINYPKLSTKPQNLTQELNRLAAQTEAKSWMRSLGLSRIHLKQTYRKVPVLEDIPKRISWTWANTRSIKQISVDEAFNMLRKCHQDVGITKQLQLLAAIPQHEKLAVVQELAPHLRTNIFWSNQTRQMSKGTIPIFIPENGQNLPIFSIAQDKKGKDHTRNVRKDTKICDEIFLPAIRAHRYLKNIT